MGRLAFGHAKCPGREVGRMESAGQEVLRFAIIFGKEKDDFTKKRLWDP